MELIGTREARGRRETKMGMCSSIMEPEEVKKEKALTKMRSQTMSLEKENEELAKQLAELTSRGSTLNMKSLTMEEVKTAT